MEDLAEIAFCLFVWGVLSLAGWAYRLPAGPKRTGRISILWSANVASTLMFFVRPMQRLIGFQPLPVPLAIRGVLALISIITLLAITAGEGGFADESEGNLYHWRPWAVLIMGFAVIGTEFGLLWLFSLVQV